MDNKKEIHDSNNTKNDNNNPFVNNYKKSFDSLSENLSEITNKEDFKIGKKNHNSRNDKDKTKNEEYIFQEKTNIQ